MRESLVRLMLYSIFDSELLILEELLIDFRELVGEHSGENIAEAVWETLTYYNIQNKVKFTAPF